MSKRLGSLKYQIKNNFDTLLRFGESRHQAKINGDTKGIYSHQTLKTYTEQMINFSSWVKENFNEKDVSKMEKFIPQYITHLQDEGMSAYTQSTALAAMSKYYQKDYFKAVEHDKRERSQIKRGRNGIHPTFSEQNNKELVSFCKSTGLRRSELLKLKGQDFKIRDNQLYIVVRQGKGGKHREVKVLGDQSLVLNKMRSVRPNQPVWEHIHSHAPIHLYRAEYASKCYSMAARDVSALPSSEVYRCRKEKAGIWYDKKALLETSQQLGHNRIDVIVNHYLTGLE